MPDGTTLNNTSYPPQNVQPAPTNTSYPPQNVQPSTAYPPPNVQPAPVGPSHFAPSPIGSTVYTPADLSPLILKHESGSTSTNLKNPTSPAGAVGPGQIMPKTAAPYLRPGENLRDPATNIAVHDRIMADYAKRWPNDPARWAVAYFSGPGNVAPPGSPTPWIKNTGDGNNTVAQYVAATAGKLGAPGSNAPATAAAPAAQPLTVGAALGVLNTPNDKGVSPLDDASKMFGNAPEQQQAQQYAQQAMLGQQQAAAAMGMARQQQIAARAEQLAAVMRQSAAKPLSWGSQPFGADAGQLAPPPGTTLNSTGGQGYG